MEVIKSESIYMNVDDAERTSNQREFYSNVYVNSITEISDSAGACGRIIVKFRSLAAGCLGFLCVLLLIVIIVLCMKNNIVMQRLWRDYENITLERDQLQIRYNNATVDKNVLHGSYETINMEKSRLLALNFSLTSERDALQKKLSELLPVGSCSNPWRKFSSSCYFLFSKKKSWEESRKDCKNKGADLAIINSMEEQKFVSGFGMKIWIGLTDQEQEGQWKWVDNTPLESGYWRNSEPNNSGNEDCAELYELSWNDVPCAQELHGLCEKKNIKCINE